MGSGRGARGLRRRDYRGDVLTLQVVMDRAHSATLNGRRIDSAPGSALREAVIARAAAHAQRVGRALPVIVHESKAECTLLVHPDGVVEVLGLRGRQRAQRWLPLELSTAPTATQASGGAGSPLASEQQSQPPRRRPGRRGAAPVPAAPHPAQQNPDRLGTLPRYGESSVVQSSSDKGSADVREDTASKSYDDDTVRLAAQRLGLTPDALAAALRAVERGD